MPGSDETDRVVNKRAELERRCRGPANRGGRLLGASVESGGPAAHDLAPPHGALRGGRMAGAQRPSREIPVAIRLSDRVRHGWRAPAHPRTKPLTNCASELATVGIERIALII